MTIDLNIFQQLNTITLAFVIVAILIGQALIVFFPKDAFMVYVGLIFGFSTGFVINLIGLFGASWLGYELGSSGLFNSKKIQNHPSFLKTQQWLEKNGMKALLLGRAIPIVQYNLFSLSTGILKMERSKCLLINLLIAIPYSLFFAYIGSNSVEYFSRIYN